MKSSTLINRWGKQLATVALLIAAIPAVSAQTQWSAPAALNSYAFQDDEFSEEKSPDIATDGNGNWLAMWQVDSSATDDPEFVFAHSTNPSAGWTRVSERNLYQDSEFPDIIESHLLYAGNGTWVHHWKSETRDTSRQRFVARSTDNGHTWSAPLAIDPISGTASNYFSEFQLISDGTGTLIVSALKYEQYETFYISKSIDFGQTWSTPTEPTILNEKQYKPGQIELSIIGNEKWGLVYGELVGDTLQQVRFAVSSDAGASWHDSGVLFQENSYPDYPVAISNFGNFVVVAVGNPGEYYGPSYSDDGIMLFVSSDGGFNFNSPIRIASDGIGNWRTAYFTLSSDGDSNFALANSYSATQNVIIGSTNQVWQFSVSENAPTLVYEAATSHSFEMALAGGGGEFVVVEEHRSDSVNQLERDLDIRSISSSDGDLTWTSPVYVNPDAESDQTTIQDQDIGFTVRGNTVIAQWLANYVLMVSRSTDGGITWSEPTPVSTSSGLSDVIFVGNQTWLAYGSFSCSFSHDDGQTWSETVSLPDVAQPDNGIYPIVKMQSNAAGTLVRLQPSGEIDYHMEALRSTDGGVTWQSRMQLPFTDVEQILYTGSGNWLLLAGDWTTQIYRSSDDGITWSPTGNWYDYTARIGSDGNGTVMALYTDRDEPYTGDPLTASVYTRVSYDHGQTWQPKTLVHSYSGTSTNSTAKMYADAAPVWVEGNRWVAFSRYLLTSRDLPFDSNKVQSVDLYMSHTLDAGASWTAGEFVRSAEDPWPVSPTTYFKFAYGLVGRQVIVAWDTLFTASSLGTDSDSDILYQTGILGDVSPPPPPPPPPPPVEPPPPPPPVEPPSPPPPPPTPVGPAANFTGVWAPAQSKCKTNKKGITKCTIKAQFMTGNSGDAKPEAKSLVRFFMSDDGVLDASDVEVTTKKLAKLNPGKGKKINVKLKTSESLSGKRLIALVDPDQVVAELNEADNIVVSEPLP